MVDRVSIIKYYAERTTGNIFLPVNISNGKFIQLIWPTLAISPAVEFPDDITTSVAVEIDDVKTLYALGASPNISWKAIFQEPERETESDPEFVVELIAGLAEITTGDSVTATMKRRGRAQIYFYDKYKKNYYGGYLLVDFRILPLGPFNLYVDSANGSPQSITLNCFGYPGALEQWVSSNHAILSPSVAYTTTVGTIGQGTILGKNSEITFTASKNGTTTISYFDNNARDPDNTIIINVLDGEAP